MKRNLAVIAAVALCAVAHGQTSAGSSADSSPPSENTLESAKRELKELPAAERSRDFLGKPSLGSSNLPTLTLPGDNGSAPRSDQNKTPSDTWLQDAAKQVDAEAAARRRTTDPNFSRDQNRTEGYKPIDPPNPLAQYLEQWISPRDLELLHAGQESKSGPDSTAFFKKTADKPSNLSPSAGLPTDFANPSLAVAQTGPVVPLQPQLHNPYIEETEPSPTLANPNTLLPQASSVTGPADRARVLPSLSSSPDIAPQDTPKSQSQKPAVSPNPPDRPPTAPIIDDRKYFPQLRRF